ncbi:MAG: ABC transporter ATP-binding protein [Coriobacteriia bacterium]|nr:ABC transporter ATP-binding protein [Coriobacteriia bacterium]
MIEARGVSKSYKSGGSMVHAVKGVDLRVTAGEFVAIEGVSGSGKSTLLHLLGGLLTPSSGSVSIDGTDLGGMSERGRTTVRREKIGFVFQSFNLIETLSARENVELVMVPTAISSTDRRIRAERLLQLVGMGHRVDHVPGKLSGGEQQRVAIARALANRPLLIVADEPTGDLDSATGLSIVEMLAGLTRSEGVSMVVATHSPYVASMASARYCMSDGHLSVAHS